ncbi:MAG: hypothetical protein COW16_12295 [Sphingomonadales bacterium CG12_big_fil_rev_8_21_14_0_65_65_10]|nr:MAG: hypothetical protein COW16_12295 [Sphingomonadales bacterium CG12_big_fil_rev_8_21_14_0_65_65_10]
MSFLPPDDLEYLETKGIAFEQRVDGNNKGIVIRGWPLPDGMYDQKQVDLLILIPNGYPDVRPDMFHLMPWVRLAKGNKYPKAADQPVNFDGKSWQRWSRHCDDWRPGIDGIWTMLKRVEHALLVAA